MEGEAAHISEDRAAAPSARPTIGSGLPSFAASGVLPPMPPPRVLVVNDLKRDRRVRYIILFKNHGEAAGASLEHPHCQLIALPVIPKRVREEVDASKLFYEMKERCIFCDIIRQETALATRLVTETERFAVLEPYAPRFPFETWILPKRHESHFEDADAKRRQRIGNRVQHRRRRADRAALADALGAGDARLGHGFQMMNFEPRDFRHCRHEIIGE